MVSPDDDDILRVSFWCTPEGSFVDQISYGQSAEV